jgi:nitrite reductase/ring-hydroxylating ferredoxin subunit/multimeric flavodoxin WrbA
VAVSDEPQWVDVGAAQDLRARPLTPLQVGELRIALSWSDGRFGAVSAICNHAGGPLGDGRLDGEYIVCPWHGWKFHRCSGVGEPGYEADRVPRYAVREADGRVYVSARPETPRARAAHAPHPLARAVQRAPGPIRVAGISSTIMQPDNPRYSTSEALLEHALQHAAGALACETRLLRLRDLKFRACEGYYSRSARACTWPCSITQADDTDELTAVYEALVHWADVILVATPIRWGAASSLYYRMAERMNCIQNQITLHDRVLIQRKVAAFVVTGGQDGIQAVAGQMLGFFAELGFMFPAFPYVAHSLGWTAEDMERNVAYVQASEALRTGTRELVERGVAMAGELLERPSAAGEPLARGGRKASGTPGAAGPG